MVLYRLLLVAAVSGLVASLAALTILSLRYVPGLMLQSLLIDMIAVLKLLCLLTLASTLGAFCAGIAAVISHTKEERGQARMLGWLGGMSALYGTLALLYNELNIQLGKLASNPVSLAVTAPEHVEGLFVFAVGMLGASLAFGAQTFILARQRRQGV